jgi:predicted nucleic acid-binding protein
MREVLLDTSVIMRLFDTTSAPEQTAKAKRLFALARKGDIALVIAPPSLFEVAWVLRSALKWENSEVFNVLESIISYPGVKVLDKDRAKSAIATGRSQGGGFADSYLAATAADNTLEVATFDEKHFRKLGSILYNMQ